MPQGSAQARIRWHGVPDAAKQARRDPPTADILGRVRVLALSLLVLLGPCALAGGPAEDAGGSPDEAVEAAQFVDEDEQYARKQQVYAFNPVQARNELKVGNYYAKKGSFRAAAGRYLEATRWDAGFAEAYWRLGMARERLGEAAAAVDAYRQFLTVESGTKRARQALARLTDLEERADSIPDAAGDAGATPRP